MTRKEQIEEFIKFHTHKFSVRNGYETIEELMREMAQWCDNNPKSPWISVENRLPEEDRKKDGSRKYYSQLVFIRYEKNWDGQTKPSVYYGTSFVFYTSNIPVWNSHNMREGQCAERITHWMPIPETTKGGII